MNVVAGQGGGSSALLRRELPREKQALLQKRLRDGARRREVPAPAIPKGNSTEGPLSFGQQRFWFLDQLEPGQPVYHVPFGLRLDGPLDRLAVAASLTEIVRRHEALRTTFTNETGTPLQAVLPPRAVEVPLIDLEYLRGDEELIERALAHEAVRPTDLKTDSPLRASLFRIERERHVLLITVHHIATDAWSNNLLIEEWTALYNAAVRGEMPKLPELPIQYLDFALWQRQHIDSATVQKQLAYWKQQLADAPAALELPSDTPRPNTLTNHGATQSLELSRQLSQGLADLARQAGATKFITLLAAFKILLLRCSGQEDILVGSPISGRAQKETERLIGLFLNISVLRTSLAGDPTFRQLLDRVRHTTLQAFAHQDVPFERVVEELQPVRDLSRTPFFQVMFTFQDASPPAQKLARDLRAEFFELDIAVSPFDVTLLMQQPDDRLLATLEYKTDLFSAATIERMLGHFQTLLEGIIQNPDARISELPLLTPAQCRQLLVEFNPAPTPFPHDKGLHELFEEQAARTPDRPAVKFGSHALCFAELNERANRLAHYLQTLGVRAETPVAICMERSLDMIVGVLGILKAGGAYVPLEPDEPPERLAFKLCDARARILLTQQRLAPALPRDSADSEWRVVCVDRDHPAICRHSSHNPRHQARAENLAYVIYTSGSTGTPKGVMVEHRSLVNHSLGMARRFELSSTDRVLQFAPLSFDVSAEEIFPTLLAGALLVLRPTGLAVSPHDFHPFVTNEKLTALNLPTPFWSEWMTAIEGGKLTLPSSLRLVIVGSDTVTREQYTRWQNIAGKTVRWCNAYGTTEATITTTLYEPAPGDAPHRVPIGRPTANTQVYILDGNRQLAPIGVPGEIYVGGAEVARGYLNRPEATAASFVPDVFRPQAGALLNRTGDFGRWRPDGNIEFLGRRDSQVKIRGFRIELGEVESALLQHPAVKDAAVLPREDNHRDKILVAYVVPRQNAGAEAPQLVGKLLGHLRQRLPAYMVPAMLVPLPELPRLGNGKLDAQALPNPGANRPDLEEAFVAPGDSLEQKLAGIWRQVLGLETVGVHDNFFNLGGHSLLAVRLFAEIEKLTGWTLPVLALFQSPTIKGLAEIIRRTQFTSRATSILPVQPHGTRPPFFLVHGAGGGMLWGYVNLAKHIGDDQPIYAFNSRGLAGLEEFPTIEQIAAQYVQDLRAFQPRGPYYLGGYCFGGLIAFEIARQLLAQGEHVALLALMNSTPPNSAFEKIRCTPRWAAHFARNSWHWFSHFASFTPRERRKFLERKWRALKKRLPFVGRPAAKTESIAEDQVDLSSYSENQRRLWEVHLRACDNYHPQPYPGEITVIRTHFHPFLCSFDPSYGWSEFARAGVTVKLVRGAHESILVEPFVSSAAATLKDCLAQSHASGLEVLNRDTSKCSS